MILAKNRQTGILVIVIASALVLLLIQPTFCGPRHAMLVSSAARLGDSFDPQECKMILDEILLFDEECREEIGILDCS